MPVSPAVRGAAVSDAVVDGGSSKAGSAAGEAVRFPAKDGQPVAGRWFAPVGTPWGAVSLAPGVGIPQGFYKRAAAHLAAAGLGVLSFDYRGVGEARPKRLRGRPETLLDWALLDHGGALEAAARRLPGLPRFALCHSFGGQTLGLLPGATALQAAIIVSAASGDLRHWPAVTRLRYQAQMAVLVPILTTVLGKVPGKLMGGEDLPPGVARQWARWTLTPGYLAGAEPARMAHDALTCPIHVYATTDDPLGPTAAVDELASWYSGAAVSRHPVRPADLGRKVLGHVGLFKTGAQPIWDRWVADLRAAAELSLPA